MAICVREVGAWGVAICVGGVRTWGVVVCGARCMDLERVAARRVGSGSAEAGGAWSGHF